MPVVQGSPAYTERPKAVELERSITRSELSIEGRNGG